MATQQADIYSRWLGITETARPLNHYQLLRLKKFEDDTGQIRSNYNKMSAHIRKYLSTEYADRAHALLNELTRAMLCLTDTRRKSDYDSSIGRAAGSGESRKKSLEDILVGRKHVTPEQLAKAQQLSKAIGVDLRDALVQQKAANPEVITQALAESQGLSYVDLLQMDFDIDLLGKVPATLARQHSTVPIMVDQDRVLIASSIPVSTGIEDELRLRLGLPVRAVLCTPAAIHEIVNRYYPREAAAREMGVTARQGAGSDEEDLSPEELAERKKNRAKMAGAAFALTFAGFSILGAIVPSIGEKLGGGFKGMILTYVVGAVLGSIVGGITWLVKKK
ncbi:MAG TPA: hypothetical protein VHZ24_02550 [Pirellulales bacterium]|jgi:hypothetical protein|nr:hypothetical protein [Pirellulales bacterium]